MPPNDSIETASKLASDVGHPPAGTFYGLGATAVVDAGTRLASVVRLTSLEPSDRLSDELGVTVLLKREDQQITRSYKVRGAYNLISSLDAAERASGVVCASAGNHAQGLALSCAILKIKGQVFLPANAPRQKREFASWQSAGRGSSQVIVGSSYDEASRAARAHAASTGAIYVHPFDDPRTIAGQGTVAMEVIATHPEPIDTIVVLSAEGGSLRGWPYGSERTIRRFESWARAEPKGVAGMAAALAKNGPVALSSIDTFVDGAAVGRVGDLTYPIVRELVDEVVAVPEGAVSTEMLNLYQWEGIIAEPAGALASAAARRFLTSQPQGPVVCIISGGNNDVSRYAEVVERSLLHEGLRHYFLVTFPQGAWSLASFSRPGTGPR